MNNVVYFAYHLGKMLGLRQKILFAFAGLFLLLVLVAGLGMLGIERVSRSFDQIFRENLTSIHACREMREAAGEMNQILMLALWEQAEPDVQVFKDEALTFDKHLRFQLGNITLTREKESTDSLATTWRKFRDKSSELLSSQEDVALRKQSFNSEVRPLFRSIQQHTHDIADLNFQNILSADGQVRAQARSARRAMLFMLFSAGLLVLVLLFLLGKFILKPIRTLTRSAQEIEKGNLDLTLESGSRDELGQLAEAFNAMAVRLREFRRSDRAKLERIQASTQIAINSLPDAVAVLSNEGVVELSNDSAASLFGIKPGCRVDGLGLPGLESLFEKVCADFRPFHPESYESVLQVFREGQERFYLPHAIPLLDEEAALSGVTLVLADVTELRRLDETKSDLLSTVSHEFKTRLTSIRMTMHLLMDEKIGALNDRQSDLLIVAREDSEHLHRMIESLLDIGRIRAGRMNMELKSMDANAIIAQTSETFRSAFQSKGIQLSLSIPAILPHVIADESRVTLVFSNLLDNALKYTGPGGMVEIDAIPEPDFVQFQVRDSGRGIAKDDLKKVFERFFRGAHEKDPGGAGLGLAIAKEIVEALGGTIRVVSNEGMGSTFSFTLKRADSDTPNPGDPVDEKGLNV